MKSLACNFVKRWDRFWFAPIDLYKVGLFRAVFGLTILAMYLLRHQSVQQFFFTSGLLPASEARNILPEFLLSPLPVFFHSDALNYWGHTAFVALILLFTLGLVGRWGTWIIFILSLGFNQRNFPLIYGADLFSHFWLFYLSFINHTRYFSLWNVMRRWFLKRKHNHGVHQSFVHASAMTVLPDVHSDIVSSAFVRLVQIQLCLSYAYTGIEKLKGMQWWEGSAIWYVVGMKELVAVDLSYLRHFPTVIALMSMLTVVFEVYFIFAVWNKSVRPYWLLLGLGLHIGIALFMSLPFFGLVMLAPYILFLDSQRLRGWAACVKYKLGCRAN